MNVAALCTRLPVTMSRDDSVLAAARQMLDQEVGTVVVIDEAGLPEGILTDRDIVTGCVAENLGGEATPVSRIMTSKVHTVHEDDSAEVVLESMADHEVRRLVVINDAGRVTGIVSLDDVIDSFVTAATDVGRLLRRQVQT